VWSTSACKLAEDIAGRGSKALVARPDHAISLDGDEDDERPAFLAMPSQEDQEGWYPTLRVTLWVLSCLWSYVDVSPFSRINDLHSSIGTDAIANGL
jgi:hypothetical protein